jgi:CubicO group peptidase (beta-lactamase class C family)
LHRRISSHLSGSHRSSTAWGLSTTVRDYAKFGYLYLKEGEWDGQQVVSRAWVHESTSAISDELDHYGYQWWLPYGWASYRDAGVTPNTFLAMGIFVQRIIVVPEHNIVAVRVGWDDESEDPEWSTAEFIRLIQEAIM